MSSKNSTVKEIVQQAVEQFVHQGKYQRMPAKSGEQENTLLP
jgi:hypothetical protein